MDRLNRIRKEFLPLDQAPNFEQCSFRIFAKLPKSHLLLYDKILENICSKISWFTLGHGSLWIPPNGHQNLLVTPLISPTLNSIFHQGLLEPFRPHITIKEHVVTSYKLRTQHPLNDHGFTSKVSQVDSDDVRARIVEAFPTGIDLGYALEFRLYEISRKQFRKDEHTPNSSASTSARSLLKRYPLKGVLDAQKDGDVDLALTTELTPFGEPTERRVRLQSPRSSGLQTHGRSDSKTSV